MALSRRICSADPAQVAAGGCDRMILACQRLSEALMQLGSDGHLSAAWDALIADAAATVTQLLPALTGTLAWQPRQLWPITILGMFNMLVMEEQLQSANARIIMQRDSAGPLPPLVTNLCLEALALNAGAFLAVAEVNARDLAGAEARDGAVGNMSMACTHIAKAHHAQRRPGGALWQRQPAPWQHPTRRLASSRRCSGGGTTALRAASAASAAADGGGAASSPWRRGGQHVLSGLQSGVRADPGRSHRCAARHIRLTSHSGCAHCSGARPPGCHSRQARAAAGLPAAAASVGGRRPVPPAAGQRRPLGAGEPVHAGSQGRLPPQLPLCGQASSPSPPILFEWQYQSMCMPRPTPW